MEEGSVDPSRMLTGTGPFTVGSQPDSDFYIPSLASVLCSPQVQQRKYKPPLSPTYAGLGAMLRWGDRPSQSLPLGSCPVTGGAVINLVTS